MKLRKYQNKLMPFIEILKGNFKSMKDFKRVMTNLAAEMHFEEAQNQKEKIGFRELPIRSTIVNKTMMFSIVSDEAAAYVNFLQISTAPSVRSHYEIKTR
jgi:excinuclease ABC subunit C